MSNLIFLAGAIPFAIVFVVVLLLASVRCSITATHVQVSILGFTVRKLKLSDITSVEYIDPEQTKRHSLLNRHGIVLVHGEGGGALAVTPRDPHAFMEELSGRVFGLTGRRV